jgi:site-specific DNA-methyltransferase (adenine-specific)
MERIGDMKITDRIELVQKDAFEWLDTLEGESIDLLLTDTPYAMNFQSGRRKEKHIKIENDNNLDWLPNWLLQIKRILKQDSHAYIFCSNHFVDVFVSEIKKVLPYKNIIIWEKNNHGSGDLFGDFAPKYEMIIFCSNGNKKLNGNRDANIIKAKRTQNDLHPTEKPVNLMEYLIEKSTNQNDLVLDCFAGSGSTAIACHNVNRKFIGCEIELIHFNTAIQRIKNHVSQQKLF